MSAALSLIEDRISPEESEALRVFSLKGHLLVCEALEAAAWAKEMEKRIKP